MYVFYEGFAFVYEIRFRYSRWHDFVRACWDDRPSKRGVKLAIEKARKAGVKTIMITGDHKLTAFSIAKELGIASSFEEVVEGEELEKNEKYLKEILIKFQYLRGLTHCTN